MSPLRIGVVLSLLCAPLLAQPTLTVSPAVIYNCNANGLGQATLFWQGAPGQVQIRLGSPNGQQMTGLLPGTGFTQTGDWVSDGLRFFLVTASGQAVAQARASVACGQNPARPTVQLNNSSYLPLAVGNTWTYQFNSRLTTASFITWTVTRKVQTAFREYFEVEVRGDGPVLKRLFREGADGKIYEYVGTATDASEKTLLDPSLLAKQPYENGLARFPDAIQKVINTNTDRTKEIFARGVGMIETTTEVVNGPVGGFMRSLTLVEVSILGGIHLRQLGPEPRGISLTVDSAFLDLSGRNAPNCAVPPYTVDGTSPDLPTAYKPCLRVRIAGFGPSRVGVNLLPAPLGLGDAGTGGGVYGGIYDPGQNLPHFAFNVNQTGPWTEYVQIPLFLGPNTPVPAGRYRVSVFAFNPTRSSPSELPLIGNGASVDIEVR